MVHSSSVLPVNAVIKPAFAVAVSVDHMLRAIFLRHIRKTAALFQNVCRRVVQEHDEFPVSVRFRKFEGFPEAHKLTLHELLRMTLRLFIPADDPASPVEIKRSFKCKSTII